MKNRSRLMTFLFLICVISSTFFMILPFTYNNQGEQVNFSSFEGDNPLSGAGDGGIPNITSIWFNGTLYDPSILWNVTSYDVVNITANITSDPLLTVGTYLLYDTSITPNIGPDYLQFTNTIIFINYIYL